jgi:hypothetical protein
MVGVDLGPALAIVAVVVVCYFLAELVKGGRRWLRRQDEPDEPGDSPPS